MRAAPRRSTSTSPGETHGATANTPQVPAANYEAVRKQIITAFQNLTDPANPGAKVVAHVFKKEELRNVDGTDALHPNRSGDVVVVFHPPYQTDAQTPGQTIAFSQFFGQHGYTPDLVNLKRNVNMHGDVHRVRREHPRDGPRRSAACARSTSRRRSRS